MDIVFTGAPNPRIGLIEAINKIEASGGGKLTIVGNHQVDGTIQATLTNGLIDNALGKTILGPGLSVPVWDLRPAQPFTGSLVWLTPRVDCSKGKLIGGQGSSTAISVTAYGHMRIYACDLEGGTHAASDSGIAPVNVVDGWILGGEIRNFGDLGIYVTGGLYPVPHNERLVIDNITIKNCRNGIDVKRGYKHVLCTNDRILGCYVAYRMSWVSNESGGGVPLPPGVLLDVVDGYIDGANWALRPEGPGRLQIVGTIVSNSRYGLIRNQGSSVGGKVTVNGNRTVKNETLTVNGVTYHPSTGLLIS